MTVSLQVSLSNFSQKKLNKTHYIIVFTEKKRLALLDLLLDASKNGEVLSDLDV
jgi:hypothetical protein